jgi:hypothetical protein
VTKSNSNQPPQNGLPTPTTENTETITLGGLTFRKIPDEEGEAFFAKAFAETFGHRLNSSAESQPGELLGEQDETKAESELEQPVVVALFEPRASRLAPAPQPELAQPAATQPPDLDTRPILPVPPGLSRCPVCNQYRGTIGIADDSIHSRKKGDSTEVQCICDGILCSRCKVNRIPRPISNQWGERGGFGHVPYFVAMLPCKECRAKEDAAYAARKRESEGVAGQKELPKEESK